MFADDVLLYHTIHCPGDYFEAQNSITAIECWSSDNPLQLNALKCYMIITRKEKPITPHHALTWENNNLERVESYKYIGLLLTADLVTPHLIYFSQSSEDVWFVVQTVL